MKKNKNKNKKEGRQEEALRNATAGIALKMYILNFLFLEEEIKKLLALRFPSNQSSLQQTFFSCLRDAGNAHKKMYLIKKV